MPHDIVLNRQFGDLFSRIQEKQANRKTLQEALQLAVQIEFTTIPAYLTALYSIKTTDSTAYQLLRSVMVEEMFHVNQAANILVAIGGLPKFTGDAVPKYPSYLPHANPNTTPYVGLYRASTDVFENVFAAIETPAPQHALPEGKCYDTIAQVYKAVEDALELYNRTHKDLFTPNPNGRQRTDIYLGKFGGKPIEVTNIKDAKLGILQITQQGEGAVPEGQSYIPAEPWATYNQYGQRTDGTYGPIVGQPYEMSHFKKFRTVALDTANFPDTYPIVSNARQEDFKGNALALAAAKAFDAAYSIMLDALELSFRKPKKAGAPDPFFAIALPMMHAVMPALARTLMNTPTRADGDNSVGPNAAPTFIYRPGSKLKDIPVELTKVIKLTEAILNESNNFSDKLSLLADALECATNMVEACPHFE